MQWLNLAAAIFTVIAGIMAVLQYFKSTGAPSASQKTKSAANNKKPSPANTPTVKVAPTPTIAGVQTFSGDDKAYQEWVTSHPQGFVVNTEKGISANYMALHKATCGHISNFASHEQGAFTERGYIKACSADLTPLKEWAKAHGRADGSFTGNCKCLSGGNQ